MTSEELDKECELLKQYIKYYVDCLAENALMYIFRVRISPDFHKNFTPEEIIEIFQRTGVLVYKVAKDLQPEKPVSFDLWKKTVSINYV